MNNMILVRVKSILGTEETDVQIDASATIDQLLQQAAPKLQINPGGATIMYQGQQLPPKLSLYRAGIRDGDTVMIAPGSIVGGADPFTEIVCGVVTPIVLSIIGNYIYDRLHGANLKELTKRLFVGAFSRNKSRIQVKHIQYDIISEKVADLIYQELAEWKRINEKHGAEILQELLLEKSISARKLRSIVGDDSELAETLGKMATSEKLHIEIRLKKDILKYTENILLEILQKV